MQLRLMLVLAEFELDRIRESWQVSRQRAVARGIHIASRTPTGYRRRADGRLEPHPDFARVVAEVFRRRTGGASWRELAALLDERGVVGPYGSPYWPPRAVTHMIANRVYLGEARSGVYINETAHEPLVDEATWEAAQHARAATPPRSSEGSMLAGLLRCAGCRYLMKPDKMTLRDGSRARIYRCRGEHAAGRCTQRAAVLGTVIEPFIEAHLLEVARGGEAHRTTAENDVGALVAQLHSAEVELEAYRDNEEISGVLGAEGFLEGLRVRVAAVERARLELGNATNSSNCDELQRDLQLVEMWADLSIDEKRRLLLATFDAVFVRRGKGLKIDARALVIPIGEAPEDLPRRGHRTPLRPFDWPAD